MSAIARAPAHTPEELPTAVEVYHTYICFFGKKNASYADPGITQINNLSSYSNGNPFFLLHIKKDLQTSTDHHMIFGFYHMKKMTGNTTCKEGT